MNLQEMEGELFGIIEDKALKEKLHRWINNAILWVTDDFELLPLKMLEPIDFPIIEDHWLFELPATFHKMLFRARDSDWAPIKVKDQGHTLDFSVFEFLDPGHREHDRHVRVAAAAPQSAGSAGPQGQKWMLGVHPRATETLHLWFYQRPAVLVKPTDVCDCIPDSFQRRVIFPRVIIQNFEVLTDMMENFKLQPLQYYQGKMVTGDLDLRNYYAKLKGGPRRHGGKDPIGPGRFYRGEVL